MSFTIYTTKNCSYCESAKNLLKEYNREYVNVVLDSNIKSETNMGSIEEFKKSTGHTTVPQIYHSSGLYIGGYEELKHYLSDKEVVPNWVRRPRKD